MLLRATIHCNNLSSDLICYLGINLLYLRDLIRKKSHPNKSEIHIFSSTVRYGVTHLNVAYGPYIILSPPPKLHPSANALAIPPQSPSLLSSMDGMEQPALLSKAMYRGEGEREVQGG